MLAKMARPCSTADDGGEVVVGQDHVGRFLGHVRTGDPHGHADVGRAQRGGVVHPVAGHGHDGALGLQSVHYPQLVLGGHPGVDGDVRHRPTEPVVVQRLQFGAVERAGARLHDAEVGGDAGRGDGVSPVIMITRTPAPWASAMASRARAGGGSMIPATPM